MQYKFRGKRKDNGEWVYGSYTHCHDADGSPSIIPHGDNRFFSVIAETVGMWTGLKDKKGIDIYDGDIIIHERRSRPYSKLAKTATVTCKVQWDSGLTEGEGKNNPSSFNRNPEFVAHPIDRKAEASNWGHSWSEFHDCEVIGNVYDNVNPAIGSDGINHMLDPNLKAEEQATQEVTEQAAGQEATEQTAEQADATEEAE